MKLSQVAVIGYGVLYFVLACLMEANNRNQSYPIVYVGFSMIAQTLVVGGSKRAPTLPKSGAGFSRFSFSRSRSASCSMQQFLPTRTAARMLNLVVSLWITAPAYYFNFRLARYAQAKERR